MSTSDLSNTSPSTSTPPGPQVLEGASATKPYRVIKAQSGLEALDLGEMWRFRDLLWTLASRDVKLRYRQTALGAIWVVLQPLLGAGIFSFVFGSVAKLPSGGVPYFVFAYAGLLGWNAFSGTLVKASQVLVANAGMISKVFFPRLLLPLSTLASVVIDFGVALAVLPFLMWQGGVALTPQVLLTPVWVVFLLLLAMGLGLFAGALMVSYRDVGYVVPVLTSFLLYASPVGYTISAVPVAYRSVFFLNPLAGLLSALRWSLLGTEAPPWSAVAYAGVLSLIVFAAGIVSFKRMEWRFADVI